MISVCIATYNGEKYIKEQLQSILPQLGNKDEIIVSDDGSTDKTIEVINEFGDSRIYIIQDKPLHSPIFNFERAIEFAKGDFIFLSDQDDVWLPNKVEIIMDVLSDTAFVFTDAIVVDKDLNLIRDSYFNHKSKKGGIFNNILNNSYFGATIGFRKEILEYALPFPKNIPMHDQWLGLIADYYYSVKFINTPLIKHRRHGANASYSGEKSRNTIIVKLKYRINIFISLFWRVINNKK